jgi:hypothetical protein
MNAYVTNAAIAELSTAKGELQAPRTALLTCVVVLQVHDDPAVRNFCTKLLTDFPPMAGQFRDHLQAFLRDLKVLRARMQDGTVKLLLPEDGVRKLIGLDDA